MEESKEIKEKFETLYEEWLKVIQDPKIQLSSRPQDYTNNVPYKEIVRLGKDALPFILEKITQGNFFMNQAAMELLDVNLNKLVEKELSLPSEKKVTFMAKEEPKFLSEQQKSELILKHAKQGGK
jgi:hypothetical protein